MGKDSLQLKPSNLSSILGTGLLASVHMQCNICLQHMHHVYVCTSMPKINVFKNAHGAVFHEVVVSL